ncbi:hypothetical protein [Phaffia rhodozyma]|uniref:Uncharacterized protein n=1 Tax=Phaffia rhodozyma TaxID=264483 RepID=A0A0F7SGB8_PHARH|nr:hypothetical protein [Phaffia rhodozyma]
MSLEIIRSYATSHICQDHEQFTNDAIYRLLTEELCPISLNHYPETILVNPNESIELIPGVLRTLREKIDMKDNEKWDEVWDVPRKAIDLIMSVQRGLKRSRRVDGKLTDLGVRPDSFVRSVSPPPSPVLSKRALRETPKIGCFATSNSQDLSGRQTKTFLRALDLIEPYNKLGTEALKLDSEDVLDVRLSLSEKTADHVRSLLSSLPKIPKSGKKNSKRNPILESAKDRARTLEVVMNPIWAQERHDQLIHEKESTCSMSPPIFPRRLDSVCYNSRDNVDGSTVLPTTLGQIGDCIISTAKLAGLDSPQGLGKMMEDPFSMEALDEFMHVPPIPSDITFSPPSSDPELGAGFVWPINMSTEPHVVRDGEVDDLIEPPIFPRALELETHRDHDIQKWPKSLSEILANFKNQDDETSLQDEFSSTPTPRSRIVDKFKLDILGSDQDNRPASLAVSPSLTGQASPTEELHNPNDHTDLFALSSDDLVHELLGLLHEGDVSTLIGSTDGWLEEFGPTIGRGHDTFPNSVEFEGGGPSTIFGAAGIINKAFRGSTIIWAYFSLCRVELEDNIILSRTESRPPDPLCLSQELNGFIYTRKETELQGPDTGDLAHQVSGYGAEPAVEPTVLDTSRINQPVNQVISLRHDKRPRLIDNHKSLLSNVVDDPTPSQLFRPVTPPISPNLLHIVSDDSEAQVQETPLKTQSFQTDHSCADPENISFDDEVDQKDLDMFPIPERLINFQMSERLSYLSPLSHFLSTRNKHFTAVEQVSTRTSPKRSERSDEQSPSNQNLSESAPEEMVKMPQNLAEFEGFSTDQTGRILDEEEVWYHCIGGQKLLQNRRAYRSLEKSFILPHYRSHPTLSREANSSISIGLDLILTTLTAATIYPLQILPSILSQIPKLAEHLQSRYDNLYVILTIPADRETEVWTPLVISSIGKARRAIAMQGLDLNMEEGLKVKIGWVRENGLGDLLRSLLESSSTSPSKMGCLGDSWLAPWEYTNDCDEASWEEMESSLASFNRMNPFSAAWILALMNLDEFLDMDSLERVDSFGPLFGVRRMERQSEFIASRRLTLPSEDSTPSLPLSSPPSFSNMPFDNHYPYEKRVTGHPRLYSHWQDQNLEEMCDILEEDEY